MIGIRDGFEWIMKGDIDHVSPLSIERVSRIHFRGGSHIGISRANPTTDPKLLENTVISLLRLNVSQLITIGGDDTALSAMRLEEEVRGANPGGPRPEDDRQRPRPAPQRGYVRIPDRSTRRHRPGEEPHGRRQDHVPLVLHHRDGPQDRPPRAGDRQGGGGHRDPDPGGVPGQRGRPQADRRHPGRRHHQAPQLRPPGRRRRDRRRRGPRHQAGGARRGPGRRAGCPRPPPDRRGQHRRDHQACGSGPPGRARPQDHDRGQERGLRASLRRPGALRHGVLPGPRLLRRQVPPHRGQRRLDLDAERKLRPDQVQGSARPRDRDGPASAWWTSTPTATRSPGAT